MITLVDSLLILERMDCIDNIFKNQQLRRLSSTHCMYLLLCSSTFNGSKQYKSYTCTLICIFTKSKQHYTKVSGTIVASNLSCWSKEAGEWNFKRTVRHVLTHIKVT